MRLPQVVETLKVDRVVLTATNKCFGVEFWHIVERGNFGIPALCRANRRFLRAPVRIPAASLSAFYCGTPAWRITGVSPTCWVRLQQRMRCTAASGMTSIRIIARASSLASGRWSISTGPVFRCAWKTCSEPSRRVTPCPAWKIFDLIRRQAIAFHAVTEMGSC